MVVCKFFQQGNCRYGQSCRFEHIYGSKYSYRAPQHESTRNNQNVFNTNTSSGQGFTSASSLFRNAVQNTSTYFDNSSSHSFVQNQPTRPSVFDRLGPQPSNVFSNQNNSANQARSIFALANQSVFGQTQSNPNVFQSQTPNVFQTQNQAPSVFQAQNPPIPFQTQNQSNTFQAQNQSNTFQTQNQSNTFQGQNARSLFAQATQSIFGQQQPTSNSSFVNEQNRLPRNENSGNVFQISNKPTSNVFGTNNVIEQNQFNDDDIYSKIEDLSKSDIEAFESEDFKLGFIPELPPPRALCVM